MGFFNKRKNKENPVVWRDASGKITCPGDSCPKDCDDTCPIYLNTQAGMMCQLGMGDKAISRPQYYSDRLDEAVDMLLHILDQYTEQEYKDIMR